MVESCRYLPLNGNYCEVTSEHIQSKLLGLKNEITKDWCSRYSRQLLFAILDDKVVKNDRTKFSTKWRLVHLWDADKLFWKDRGDDINLLKNIKLWEGDVVDIGLKEYKKADINWNNPIYHRAVFWKEWLWMFTSDPFYSWWKSNNIITFDEWYSNFCSDNVCSWNLKAQFKILNTYAY